ncbi:aldo/keto reductase [Acidimicrobium ferrooxidans DSM 10331]|uniref:Aldo/keto reductase n=1 Tax=Acidimicrobium ferrooxidans (strain DSM 10331 / JCM 15462 / NBRC 103882 / ICP) TaxID=525909 RepID=C7LY58_ACIFD|nr:aldo/keto reductase [Acidimicrobium ferrooxidans]ACU53666.1 aldo/keto reductase [Acidimicrobium ferrooxidans DSM 10331]
MRYVEAAGLKVSAVGLGTWQFGSREWGYGEAYANHDARLIVERALELGVTLFDTAEVYGSGRSERILGEALASSRANVVVATKYAPTLPIPGRAARHLRASAQRLGRDAIDLYQVHFPNPLVPTHQLLEELEAEVFAGGARALGVSNFSLAAWRAAERTGHVPIVSNQVHLSLVVRRSLRELVPWAQANDRLVIAYSPLEQGLLAGTYTTTHRPRGVRRLRRAFSPTGLLRARPVLDELRRVGTRYGASPAQVALAWVLSHPNVVAIPGASSVSQLEHNVEAGALSLTNEDVVRLEASAQAAWPVR